MAKERGMETSAGPRQRQPGPIRRLLQCFEQVPSMTSNRNQPKFISVDEAMTQLLAIQQRAISLFVERRSERLSDRPTRIQTHVLHIVREHDTISVSHLARILSVSMSTVSQLVTTLVERGWLRVDLSSTDRRRHDIHITQSGVSLLEERHQKRLARIRQVIEQLSPEDRTMLVTLLDRSVTIWQSTANSEGSSIHGH